MNDLLYLIVSVFVMAILSTLAVSNSGDGYYRAVVNARALDLMNEGSEIEQAFKVFQAKQAGKFPEASEPGETPIDVLVEEGYLARAPKSSDGSSWTIDGLTRTALGTMGPVADDELRQVCVKQRELAGVPNPEVIYKCDGSDAPGGQLERNDVCCIG